MSWAKGMFEKPKRRSARGNNSASNNIPGRQKQDTLTELRWHLELPTDGDSAFHASQHISKTVLEQNCLAVISPEELQEGRDNAEKAEASTKGTNSMRMQDVSSGLRLRYLVWGEDERVVVLLHDLGDAAGVFAGLGPRLASRGYKVFAIDLRGHGHSSYSADRQYSPESLSDDLESFITEQDLYVRPIALVGLGMGAAVAAQFVSTHEQLVGALVLAEFGVNGPRDRWLYHPAQAARFASIDQATAFLCSRQWGHPPRHPPLVAKHQPFRCMAHDDGSARLRMDPHWCFAATPAALQSALSQVRCDLLVVHGASSHHVSRAEAEHVAQSATSAASTHVYTIPDCGHYILEDSPLKLRNAVLGFLLKCDEALLVHNKAARRPEMLGLRTLPQYATLEDAIKALAPREVPSDEMVEAELAKLRADDECDSDEDEYAGKRTALAKDDAEYFAFVG